MSARPAELIRRTQQTLAALYAAGNGRGGLPLPQFAVLEALKNRGPQNLTALVSLTGIDRSTMSDMIRRMRTEGLVSGQRGEPDARAIVVTLEWAGRKALAGSETALWNAEVKIMAAMSPVERTKFLNALAIVAYARPRRDR